MDQRAFRVYLVTGLLTLAIGAAVVAATYVGASVTGNADLPLKLGGFLVSILSGLPFEKCVARRERIDTLWLLKRRCEELDRDPTSPGHDLAWLRGMIDKLYEKRLLG